MPIVHDPEDRRRQVLSAVLIDYNCYHSKLYINI